MMLSPHGILYLWSALFVIFIFNMILLSIIWMQYDYLTDLTHGLTWDRQFHESRITLLEMERGYFQIYDPETGGLKIMNMSSLVIHEPPPLGTPMNPGFPER